MAYRVFAFDRVTRAFAAAGATNASDSRGISNDPGGSVELTNACSVSGNSPNTWRPRHRVHLSTEALRGSASQRDHPKTRTSPALNSPDSPIRVSSRAGCESLSTLHSLIRPDRCPSCHRTQSAASGRSPSGTGTMSSGENAWNDACSRRFRSLSTRICRSRSVVFDAGRKERVRGAAGRDHARPLADDDAITPAAY